MSKVEVFEITNNVSPLDDAVIARHCRRQLDEQSVHFGHSVNDPIESGRSVGKFQQILIEARLGDQFVGSFLLGAEAELEIALK